MTTPDGKRATPFDEIGSGPEWDAYMALFSDYIRRQVMVYQNWPQRKFTPVGYADEKVFTDMNA